MPRRSIDMTNRQGRRWYFACGGCSQPDHHREIAAVTARRGDSPYRRSGAARRGGAAVRCDDGRSPPFRMRPVPIRAIVAAPAVARRDGADIRHRRRRGETGYPVPAEGIEPPTFGLQNRCTTAVLRRRRPPLNTGSGRGPRSVAPLTPAANRPPRHPATGRPRHPATGRPRHSAHPAAMGSVSIEDMR